ncbi:M48 family metalloprotease [bacterium]|nr:M48 family metalloprotease [bacterium]
MRLSKKRRNLFHLFLLFFPVVAYATSDLEHILADVTKEAFNLQYGLIDNPLLNGWVKEIGLKLSEKAGVFVNFYLVDSEQINAYATFGNNVFLTKGLLNAVDSEDELACVLAHELAHIKLKHPQKQTALIAFSLALLSGLDLKGKWKLFAKALLALLNLGFSREQERMADEEGLRIILKSGFNPRGFINFFKKLGEEKSPSWAQYLATHPSPAERIKRWQVALDNITDEEWEKIYLSLLERGEAGEARELKVANLKQPPPLSEKVEIMRETKELTSCRDKLSRIYSLSKQIANWQNILLFAKLSYELSLLAGEALLQRNRLEEMYMQCLSMYNNVNIYQVNLIQNGDYQTVMGDLNSGLDECINAGEILLLASAALSTLALSNRLGNTSLLTLQSLLIDSSYHLTNAKGRIIQIRNVFLDKGIELLLRQLDRLDSEWLRNKCAHRLGAPLDNFQDVQLGYACFIEAVSKLLAKPKEVVEEMYNERKGNIGEILKELNFRKEDLEALSIFLGSLVRGN